MQFKDKGQTQRSFTKDGYLVVPATLSKIGVFDYLDTELAVGDKKEIKKVARTETSLFSDETIKSFEGVPITVGHPKENVNAKNWKALSVGVVRNVVRDNDVLKGEAWIYDEGAIRLIKDKGIQELSCGYESQINPSSTQGIDFEMSPMIGNHVAVVAKGRCGESVKLADEDKTIMSKSVKFIDAFLGAFGISLSDEQKKKVEEDEEKDTEGKKPEDKPQEKNKPDEKPNDNPPDDNEKEKKKVKDEALVKENAELKAKIQKLEDEAKASQAAQKRAAILADAQTVAPKLTFADSDTARQIQEKVITDSGVATQETLKTLSDEAVEGMYQAAKNVVKKLQDRQLGSLLLNDHKSQEANLDFNKLYGGQA